MTRGGLGFRDGALNELSAPSSGTELPRSGRTQCPKYLSGKERKGIKKECYLEPKPVKMVTIVFRTILTSIPKE